MFTLDVGILLLRAVTHLCTLLLAIIGGLVLFVATPAQAATCSSATTQGGAPASWQSYCWLDFTSYNDATARSAPGQNFTFSLSDGSTLSFNLKASSSAATAATATTAPSWSGAAVGNSSFIGIPGKPILYTVNSGSTITFAITGITITPPPGVAAITNYAFVIADAESTDNAEYLDYTTNGSPWAILDTVPAISGTRLPILTGVGTTNIRQDGGGQPSPIGAYIAGSNKPTNVSATLKAGGLQGIMFAVRFASIKLNKTITGARIDPLDQFNFSIRSTSSGTALAAGVSTGAGNGPFAAAVISTASGIPITLTESMASGSSALSQYRGALTCINATAGSATPMPNNLVTSSYNFGALDFGDIVSCTFNNAAYPQIKLSKALGTGGRIFATDQFTVRLKSGAAILATATTGGTGTVVTAGDTGFVQGVAGTGYQLDEIASGSTTLSRYSKTLACNNAYISSPTTLPGAIDATFTPAFGDVISCVITNDRQSPNAVITITKTSDVLADPISSSNPKAIPGATISYSITVTNQGDLPVDANTIIITDPLPSNLVYNAGSPVVFTNGSTPSGLTAFNPATMVSYSNQVGGGAPYTYIPGGGYDAAVRGIRINPAGTLAASNGTNHPSFTLSFQMQVK